MWCHNIEKRIPTWNCGFLQMQKNGFVDVQVRQQIQAGTVGADACCCAPKHLNAKGAADGGTEERTEAALNCAGKK